jgi:GntR family transcriptional regulator, rspAB operon transcriptional repressor
MRQHLREILKSLPELAERFPEFFERDQAPDTNLT